MTESQDFRIKDTTNPHVLSDFIKLPYELYKPYNAWVAPLISEEKKIFSPKHNSFLRNNRTIHFVCYKDNKPVGRIAGIINSDHNDFHKDKTAFFGFFECIDDINAAKTLFKSVEEWTKNQGFDSLRGPTNYSLNDIAGLLIDGFSEPPSILMPYNPPYYEKLYRACGFDMAMRFFAYTITKDSIRIPSFINKLEDRLKDNEITFRTLDAKNIDKEFKIILGIFNESWSENWGFIPFRIDDAVTEFKKIKFFLKEKLIIIAEHNGEPAGFILGIPDINQALSAIRGILLPFGWFKAFREYKKINRIRVALMGVMKDYRQKGIDMMLYKKIVENSVALGYDTAELSWILENNGMMNRVLEHIGARKNKDYGMFEKKLN